MFQEAAKKKLREAIASRDPHSLRRWGYCCHLLPYVAQQAPCATVPSDMAVVQLCRSAIAKGQQLGLKDEVKEAQRVLAEEEAGRNVFGHLYLGMMRYYDEIRSELWSRMLVFLFPSLSLSLSRLKDGGQQPLTHIKKDMTWNCGLTWGELFVNL